MKRDEFIKSFADMIIKKFEAGVNPFRREWAKYDVGMPKNPISNFHYHGVNILTLYIACMDNGYTNANFCTFRQAQAKGWHVKKGMTGTKIIYASRTPDQLDAEGNIEKSGFPFFKVSTVFNFSQIEGAPQDDERPQGWNPIEKAEQVLKESGAEIRYGNGRGASYNIREDYISLPARESFYSAEGFYSVALHELSHWTGHKSRLNRSFAHMFGTKDYAREELRAEIGSWMVTAELGIDNQDTENNYVNYLKAWAELLREKPTEILKACADAERIRAFLIEHKRPEERN